jgi:hypothetical protein
VRIPGYKGKSKSIKTELEAWILQTNQEIQQSEMTDDKSLVSFTPKKGRKCHVALSHDVNKAVSEQMKKPETKYDLRYTWW